MNLLDNGDGTYTDLDTGNLLDGYGNPINAVPNQSPLDYANTQEVIPGNLVDTAAGPVNTNGGGGSTILSGVDSFINGIESAFTNLYTPLVSAGVVQTPAQKAAAAQAANTAAAQAQQTATDNSNKTYLYLAVALAVVLLAWKAS